MGKRCLTDQICSLRSLVPDVNDDKNLILTVSKTQWNLYYVIFIRCQNVDPLQVKTIPQKWVAQNNYKRTLKHSESRNKKNKSTKNKKRWWNSNTDIFLSHLKIHPEKDHKEANDAVSNTPAQVSLRLVWAEQQRLLSLPALSLLLFLPWAAEENWDVSLQRC